ncbi:MAG TPA: universal stress protein [Gemmatimonadaceae bacterium]|nr:universal stress protein [Gemmatimonadaceae bacterium]
MKLLHLNVVLAAVDSDEKSLPVLRGARELASAAGAKLHVLHVGPARAARRSAKPADGGDGVKRLMEDAGITGAQGELHLLRGDPALVIHSLAEKIRADVIVLGSHRQGSSDDSPLGSTALRVVTGSDAPCLILSGAITLPLDRVLVPVDLSDTSRGALALALSWASALRGAEKSGGATRNDHARLTALLVETTVRVEDATPTESAALDDELRRLGSEAGTWAGVAIEGVVIRSSDVESAIARYAQEHQSDLVVIGTRGLGADARRRLGSVSEGVSRRVAVPVLLVPPAVWSSQHN